MGSCGMVRAVCVQEHTVQAPPVAELDRTQTALSFACPQTTLCFEVELIISIRLDQPQTVEVKILSVIWSSLRKREIVRCRDISKSGATEIISINLAR